MTRPVRIQLSRKKGFRLQEHSHALNGRPAVVVSRPSMWANPWTIANAVASGVEPDEARELVVTLFRIWLGSPPSFDGRSGGDEGDFLKQAIMKSVDELRGKNLACWCPLDAPCHADVLLDIANDEEG